MTSPFRDPAHGPLPGLLLVLTATTGLVDAVSILALGRVFVANMTGNVVFIGLAIAGAPGFSLAASVAALLGFLVGALLGGALVARTAAHRGKLLLHSSMAELVLLAIAFAFLVPDKHQVGEGIAITVAALSAVALGMQNTTVRSLAVPDLTTTVLTMTLTGIAADLRRTPARTTVRRVLAVLAMFLGAIVGALLVLHTRVAYPLGLVLLMLAGVVATLAVANRHTSGWQTHARG